MRSIASKAAVKIFAALLLVAPALVETSTNFPGWCRSSGRRSCRLVADKWHTPCAHGGGGGGEPAYKRAVGISGACILVMVVLQAE